MMRSSGDDESFVTCSSDANNDVVTVPSDSSRPPWLVGSATNSSVLSSSSTRTDEEEEEDDDDDIVSTTVAPTAVDDDRFHTTNDTSRATRKSSLSGMRWSQHVAGDDAMDRDALAVMSHRQHPPGGGVMSARSKNKSVRNQQPRIPFPTLMVNMSDSSSGQLEVGSSVLTKHTSENLSGPLFARNPDIVHRSMARGYRMASEEVHSIVGQGKSMDDSTMSSGPVFDDDGRNGKEDERSDSDGSVGTDLENQVSPTLENNLNFRRTKWVFFGILFLMIASLTFVTGACFHVGRCGERSTSTTASSNVRGQTLDEEAAIGNGTPELSSPTLAPRTSTPAFPSAMPTLIIPNIRTKPPLSPNDPGKEPQRVPSGSATRKPNASPVGSPVLSESPTGLPSSAWNTTTPVPTVTQSALPTSVPTVTKPALPTTEPSPEAIRINVGSTVPLTDAQGLQWQGDILSIGTAFQDDSCSLKSIYCSSRWFSDENSENMFGSYRIEIPVSFQAIYRVRLHFAELFFESPGSRIFDVRVEETLVADNLDVVAEVGGKSPYILEAERVPCLDGALSIDLVSQTENPFINAIEVLYESPFRLIVRTQSHLYQVVDEYLAGTLQLPINDWNVSMVTNFSEAFSVDRNAAVASFNEDLDRWDMSRAQSLASMFRGATSFNGNVSTWQTSRVTSMDSTFDGAASFNGDLSSWDTSSCKSFYAMFRGAVLFNTPLTSWDTGNAEDMGRMFLDCKDFNQPLFWKTSNVKYFTAMFEGTESFRDAAGSLSGWDMSNARSLFRMFASSSFRGDLSSWTVHNVRDFRSMFDSNTEFDGDLSGWKTNAARQMEGMFRGAIQFNSPSVVTFNVSQVSVFRDMFAGATSFNRNLCSWGIQLGNVTTRYLDLANMFADTSCPFPQAPTNATGPWCQSCAQ